MRHLAAGPKVEALEARLLLDGSTPAVELFGASAAVFAENQGQWADTSVHYAFQRGGAGVAFTDDGMAIRLAVPVETGDATPEGGPLGEDLPPTEYQTAALAVRFEGANVVTPAGLDLQETVFNYFVGDQADWRAGVETYAGIGYAGLYQGIDLEVSGDATFLKYAFHVAPGADWQRIGVTYDGVAGPLEVTAAGDLLIHTAAGDLLDRAPVAWQDIGGRRVDVPVTYQLLDADTVGFAVSGAYDPSAELIIDPDLVWSTYLGGSSDDDGRGIAVDASGNVLLTGTTASSGWTSGGFDTTYDGGYDAFVVKLSPTGGHLWSTYLGGSSSDYGAGIAIDASGNVLVTGNTRSSGWTSGGFDTTYSGGDGGDAFAAKLSPTGGHLWSTYLGGSNGDSGLGIAVDASGNVLVTGETSSSGWTSGGFDTMYNGGSYDAFVAKLSPTGGHLWSTYLGGSGSDKGNGIAADASGNVLVTGYTNSSGWTIGGFDTTYNGGSEAFVAKLSSTGGHVWSTYVGGSGDCGRGIAVDVSGNVLVTGYTMFSDGDSDAFVAKISGLAEPTRLGWQGGTNTSWDVAANWSPAMVPSSLLLTVFDGTPPAFRPTLRQDETVKGIDIRSAGWTINVTGHTLRIGDGGLAIGGGSTPTSRVNLDTGSLIVDYAAGAANPAAQVRDWVKAGYNAPAADWNGNGITSGSAKANVNHLTAVGVIDNTDPVVGGRTTFEGQAVDASSVLVRYTYWGDANLDGVVNFDDYDVIDYYYWFPLPAAQMGWWTGDLDMDGNVDFDDYDKIDYAYWFQGSPLGGLGAVSLEPAVARLDGELPPPAANVAVTPDADASLGLDAALVAVALPSAGPLARVSAPAPAAWDTWPDDGPVAGVLALASPLSLGAAVHSARTLAAPNLTPPGPMPDILAGLATPVLVAL